ncbi:hypothetical protein, partial [Niallia circulans]|uniref:hypothetical protein n=1 Tax=Niallia circulans TaxID=1397 RepID=UPI001C26296E
FNYCLICMHSTILSRRALLLLAIPLAYRNEFLAKKSHFPIIDQSDFLLLRLILHLLLSLSNGSCHFFSRFFNTSISYTWLLTKVKQPFKILFTFLQ